MQLVWHMARGGRDEDPNSLAGIDAACASGATRIEIDVRLLADADALLVHDRFLPDGRPVRQLTNEQARAECLPTLSAAVQRITASSAELQVDLKDEVLLSADEIRHLADLVKPLGERVVVGSMIDWNLRALRAAAPDLRLGFDPLLYFHHWEERPTDVPFPRQRGGYDYWDDHPLAVAGILSVQDYVATRLDGLHAIVPRVDEIMLHYPTLLRAVEDGVDVCALLHERSARVLAWTLDADATGAPDTFERLRAAGVDILVTNTPAAW
jgi:glycerophosphoryl diester phosphodiesterase